MSFPDVAVVLSLRHNEAADVVILLASATISAQVEIVLSRCEVSRQEEGR